MTRRETSNPARARRAFAALIVACAALAPSSFGLVTQKQLKASEARRLIAALPGEGFSRSAVRVTEVSTAGAEAVAVAFVKAAFRLRQVEEASASGVKVARPRVAEVRVGDRQWEDAGLVLRALNADPNASVFGDVESLAVEFAERERARREAESERAARESAEAAAGGGAAAKEKKKEETARPAAADEVRRGAVTVKALTSMLSATAVEAEVELAFRFRLEGGRWRAEAARVSGGEWVELARVASALNAEKAARARAEMRAVGAALEAFRRERGFYVVSDSHVVLIDHLNPRYMKPVVRLDPWHRPYRYRGTRDAYRITSDGADGRENTDDDLNVASGP